jgi:NADPH-dependent ferric siderophore reductase
MEAPHNARHILLVGDETALPAIAGILEQLADTGP